MKAIQRANWVNEQAKLNKDIPKSTRDVENQQIQEALAVAYSGGYIETTTATVQHHHAAPIPSLPRYHLEAECTVTATNMDVPLQPTVTSSIFMGSGPTAADSHATTREPAYTELIDVGSAPPPPVLSPPAPIVVVRKPKISHANRFKRNADAPPAAGTTTSAVLVPVGNNIAPAPPVGYASVPSLSAQPVEEDLLIDFR